eukprot:714048-Prymnesium_polylepis.1
MAQITKRRCFTRGGASQEEALRKRARTIALALVLRKNEDACDVVAFMRSLLLAEVAHQRMAPIVHFTKHIEQERVNLQPQIAPSEIAAQNESREIAHTMNRVRSACDTHIVVQRLVIEEELREQAETLAVDLGLGTIDLKDGEFLRLQQSRSDTVWVAGEFARKLCAAHTPVAVGGSASNIDGGVLVLMDNGHVDKQARVGQADP